MGVAVVDTQSPESRTKDNELDEAVSHWQTWFGLNLPMPAPLANEGDVVTIDGKQFWMRKDGEWQLQRPYIRKNGQWVPIK